MNGRKNIQSGFTFLEIAVALAIISVAFVSLITLMNTSVGLTDYADRVTKATFLAQKILAEKELANDFELGEGEKVELEEEYEGYSYKMHVLETPLPLIREVRFTVYFSSLINEHSFTVTTFVVSEEPLSVDETKGTEG